MATDKKKKNQIQLRPERATVRSSGGEVIKASPSIAAPRQSYREHVTGGAYKAPSMRTVENLAAEHIARQEEEKRRSQTGPAASLAGAQDWRPSYMRQQAQPALTQPQPALTQPQPALTQPQPVIPQLQTTVPAQNRQAPTNGNVNGSSPAAMTRQEGTVRQNDGRASGPKMPSIGRFGAGNIDLFNRPQYRQPDGSLSTVNSISIGTDDGEVLIPTIGRDAQGRPVQWTDDEAIEQYNKTGQYLGKFNTVEEADRYADQLHRQQEIYYGSDIGKSDPASMQRLMGIRGGIDRSGGVNQTIGNARDDVEILRGEPKNLTREGQWAARHPYAGTAMYGVANVVGSGEGVFNTAEAALRALATGEKMDPNAMKAAPLAQAYRTGSAEGFRRGLQEGITAPVAKAIGIDSDDGRYSRGEQAMDFLSGVVADRVSSLMNMGIAGGLSGRMNALTPAQMATIGTASGALMGANAANQSLYETFQDEDTTARQALALGITSGIWEALFEAYSTESFLSNATPTSIKDLLVKTAAQFGVEFQEEAATEGANIISDYIIRGDDSEIGKDVAAFKANNPDADPNEVARHALLSALYQVSMAGLGGGLSGAMGGGVMALNQFRGGTQLRSGVRSGDVSLNDIANTADTSTPQGQRVYELANDLARREAEGRRTGAMRYGALNNAIINDIEANWETRLEQAAASANARENAIDRISWDTEQGFVSLDRESDGSYTFTNERGETVTMDSQQAAELIPAEQMLTVYDYEGNAEAQNRIADTQDEAPSTATDVPSTAPSTADTGINASADNVNADVERQNMVEARVAPDATADQNLTQLEGETAQQSTEAQNPVAISQQNTSGDQYVAQTANERLEQAAQQVTQRRTVEKAAQLREVYEARKNNNPNLQSIVNSATMLSSAELERALNMGARDALVNTAAQEEISNGRQEGEGLSGQRGAGILSQRTGERTGRVSAETEAVRRIWRSGEAPADSGAEVLRFTERRRASEVIPESSEDSFVFIPANKTELMEQGEAEANSFGLNVVSWAGGEAVSDKGNTFRGATVPGSDELYAQADNADFSQDKIIKHEIAENKLSKAEFEQIIEEAKRKSDFVKAAIEIYQSLSGEDEYRSAKELVCDSNGRMNQFEKRAQENPDNAGYQVIREILQRAIDTINPIVSAKLETKKVQRTAESTNTASQEKARSVNNKTEHSVELPYTFGSKAAKVWVEKLDPEAKKYADLFIALHEIGLKNQAEVWITSKGQKKLARRDIAAKNMLVSEWNSYIDSNKEFADAAKKLAEAVPEDIRKNADISPDGRIKPTEFDERLKLMRSFMQRIVDSLPGGLSGNKTLVNGKEVTISRHSKIPSIGGEAYRKALLEERRRQYREGTLGKVAIGGLSGDDWGTMGFLATNTKTIGSGDFTTFCPQMYFGNGGCWYCYRLSALRSGTNNKLVGQNVWYTGEILRLRQQDIDSLNSTGGLRIQSFGDWMEKYTPQLLDLLVDAETVGLQIKIITKEPSMIDAVALLKEQGYGKNLYFNLSADYTIEEQKGPYQPNAARPSMVGGDGVGKEGKTYWKRALSVEEANEYRKKYPWVNIRTVATNIDEFINSLESPYVQVVTGYHGRDFAMKKDENGNMTGGYERISSETGDTLVEVESLGDNGMPVFDYSPEQNKWVRIRDGKNKKQKALADAIEDRGLQFAYYIKACCQTGRCKDCKGNCGAVARDFAVKNATNKDQESIKYWDKIRKTIAEAKGETYKDDFPLLLKMAKAAGAEMKDQDSVAPEKFWQKRMRAITSDEYGETAKYQFPQLLKQSEFDITQKRQEQRQAIFQAGLDGDEDYEDVIAKAYLVPMDERYRILQDGMRAAAGDKGHVEHSVRLPEGLSNYQRRNLEFNKNETTVGNPLKTVAGTTIKRYGWTKKSSDGVGKQLSYSNKKNDEKGSQIYLHKNYAYDVVPQNVYDKALELLKQERPDFKFNTIMYLGTNKRQIVRFDEAPDFDTAREPIPGDMIAVNVTDGTVDTGHSDQIWHHKWLWVKNDYKGFDVKKSWEWSKLWLSVIRDTKNKGELIDGTKVRIDNKGIANGMGENGKWWNEQLRYFGLPLEGEDVDYDSRTRADKFVSNLKATQEQRANEPQTDTSEDTSLNQVPASMTNFRFNSDDVVLDWGGGRYDAARRFMESEYPGLKMYVYDPFNRTKAYNNAVLDQMKKQSASVVTINNVLNVINSEKAQRDVVSESKKYLKENGVAIFTIFQGDKSGIGEFTKEKNDNGEEIGTSSWQNNLEAKEYVPMIQDYYEHVKVTGNFIIASDSEEALENVKKANKAVKDGLVSRSKPFIEQKYDMKTAEGFDAIDVEAAADDPNNTNVIRQGSDQDIRYSSKLFDKDVDDRLKASMATLFSGGGTVDFAVRSIVQHEFAVEFKEKIAAVYRANVGGTMYVDDVRTVNINPHKGRVEYLHISPVCTDYSSANNKQGERDIDLKTAEAAARIIDELQPKVVTVENVRRYKNSRAVQIIEEALERNHYLHDKKVYRASDFGGATIRERMFIRAVKDGVLPEVDTSKYTPMTWYDAVKDMIPKLPPAELSNYMRGRLGVSGIDLDNLKQPVFVLGGEKSGELTFATADKPAPTILAKSTEAKILMPDGRILRATPRVMARIQGLPDEFDLGLKNDYDMEESRGNVTNAYRVVGNGVPVQLTQGIVGPLLEENLIKQKSKETGIQYSSKLDSAGSRLTEQQVEYFKNSKVRDENGNLKRMYHGTGRADRVGTVFRSERATSGPMAYFTDDESIAKNYSRDKEDTSLKKEGAGDYHRMFRMNVGGKTYTVEDAWDRLPASKRAEIRRKAPHITMDDDYENIFYDKNANKGLGNYDNYLIRDNGGNYIKALVESWLDDGTLYGEESKFKNVLSLVGLDDVEYLDPEFRDEKVYAVYLNVTNPLVTNDIPQEVINNLRKASETVEWNGPDSNVDSWDKTNVSPQEWFKDFERDIENGTAYVWTRIPDWVTNVLKDMGYDGISDMGGKKGGVTHNVVIPFSSEQIKNIDNQNPTKDVDIRYSSKLQGDIDKKYDAALRNNDMSAARKMVDKAAKEAGYTIKAYHGTLNDFTVFDESKDRGANYWGKGFYFTSNEEEAERIYANALSAENRSKRAKGETPTIIDSFLKIENPYIVGGKHGIEFRTEEEQDRIINALNESMHELYTDEEISEFDGVAPDFEWLKDEYPDGFTASELHNDQIRWMAMEFVDGESIENNALRKLGYDGIIAYPDGQQIKNDYGSVHYVLFDNTAVKSSDVVARDDNDNIIPLSERFNPANEDIRYSSALKSPENGNDKYSLNVERSGMNVNYQISDDGKRIAISPESYLNDANWKKVHNALNRLGYGMPSVDITKKYVLGGHNLQPDQSEAVKKILGIASESKETGVDVGAAKKTASKAARTFGTTNDFKKASYLTVNGTMLDFSDGQGYRTLDHRAISRILDLPDDAGYSDGMIEFMNQGNIRLQTYGAEIVQNPNKEQRKVLRRQIESLDGEFTLDVSNEAGYNVFSVDYPEGTRPARVFADIDRYFEDGTIPEQNETDMFYPRYSSKLNDSDYAPTFYSKLQREIQNFKGDKIGAASVESYLKGKGVKDEEIKWSGIRQFLEGKKSVNKQELMQYLKENEFVIEEKTITGSLPYVDDDQNEYHTISEIKAAGERIAEERGLDPSKVKADLDNDDEVLYAEIDGERLIEAYHPDPYDLMDAGIDDSGSRWREYTLDGGRNYREIVFKVPGSNYTNTAMNVHWGDTGVLAHARVQDFDAADGGKVLFIEEIQSDWHNAGQKEGYKSNKVSDEIAKLDRQIKAKHEEIDETRPKATYRERQEAASKYREYKEEFDKYVQDNFANIGQPGFQVSPEVIGEVKRRSDKLLELEKEMNTKREQYLEYESTIKSLHEEAHKMQRQLRELKKENEKAPEAPFRTTYTDYVLKNLLRKAAEGDYDYLAWTTSGIQMERWNPDRQSTFELTGQGAEDDVAFEEGYRIEYDQQIPKFLKKYGKQWGAGLSTISIGTKVNIDGLKQHVEQEGRVFKLVDDASGNVIASVTQDAFNKPSNEAEAMDRFRTMTIGTPVPAIIVNDAMKESVLTEGQPMYSRSLTAGMSTQDLDKQINELVKKYGALPKGEKPARNVDVPMQTSDNKNTRRFVRTILESGITSADLDDSIKSAIINESLSYEVATDKDAAEYAASVIRIGGVERAQREWDKARRSDTFNKDHMALGQFLLKEYAKNNDIDNAMNMIQDLAAEGTRMGQNIQAMRMLKKYAQQVPAIGLGYIQRTVDQMNREAKAKMGKRYKEMKIAPNLAAEYIRAQTRDEIDAALGKIYKNLGSQVQKTVPEEIIDRLRTWRYMSMLGNPRTHIRNLVGNALFVPAVTLKNAIGTGLEGAMNTSVKTKSLTVTKQAMEFAKRDALDMQDVLSGESEKSIRDLIMDQRKVYKFEPLNKASKGNSAALEAEDWVFLRWHYQNALAQYITANNLDTTVQNPAWLGRARRYAVQEAQKATYRDANKVSTWLNQSKGAGAVVKYMMEGMMPFKKTPTNILRRGIEYSPAGLVRTMSKSIYDLNTGKMTVNEWIDALSSGLAGTAIFGIGMFLASTGAILGGYKDDDDKELRKLKGLQEYSVIIGNHTYTIDWAAPGSLPLFIGVETMNALKQERGMTMDDMGKAAARLVDPMINMSMLSGLNDTLDAISYSDDKLSAATMEMFYSLLGQYVPTLFGQVARTIDTTQRINYQDVNTGMSKNMLYFIEKMQNKIPLLTFSNDPYLNEFGQENSGTPHWAAALQNFVSPGYISEVKDDRVINEVARLNEAQDAEKMLPKKMPKYLGTKEDRVDLTSAQYHTFQKIAGQTAYNIIDRMIDDGRYNKLTAEQQAEAIKMAYDYSKAVGRVALQPEYEGKLTGDKKKIYQAVQSGSQAYDAILILNTAKEIKQGVTYDKDAGETQKGATLEEIMSSNISQEEKGKAYAALYPSEGLTDWTKSGGSSYDYMMGQRLADDIPDGEESYQFVYSSSKYTKQQKSAWLQSQKRIVNSDGYKLWKKANGLDMDFIKYKAELKKFKGKGKKQKIINYINAQTTNADKRKALRKMAGY